MRQHYDIAIIGGGIIGLATARALVRRGARSVIVLEAEDAVASHQSGHNSGVIHSGLYYRPGSLKARLCAAGRNAMYAFCEAENIPYRRCGKLVVATHARELPHLRELARRGRENGLRDIRLLDSGELRAYEPAAAGIAGIRVEETGIVDFAAVARSMAKGLRARGVRIRTGSPVRAARRIDNTVVLTTRAGAVRARVIVNCAGLQSDRIARMCGVDPNLRIVPFRGEYYELARDARVLVRAPIYPVPDPALPFLGVHFTPTIDGRVEAGPNAVLAGSRGGYRWGNISIRDLAEVAAFPGFWRMARTHWQAGLAELSRSLVKSRFVRDLRRLVPAIRPEDVRRGRAGVRAQAIDDDGNLVDDFRIVSGEGTIHVLNAPSPGATASISIGDYIANRIHNEFPSALPFDIRTQNQGIISAPSLGS